MPELAANHNQFAYSVSEISQALKRVVEDNFGQVRVRGEISGWKAAASGHGYLKLKDEGAVLDAVCWKGVLARMPFKPEDGIEVVCTGRLTTYPGRSNYQLVIDFMEPAGAGALMALLEKRKAMLAAEGLFDPKRKRPLPFMPRVIGVITSPTGAVIRDILHRLSDRFPCHVLVWPVLVQGEGAAAQIAKAIEGFNNIGASSEVRGSRLEGEGMENTEILAHPHSPIDPNPPRPDLLIVARGGGSLEDLWAFNEEIVVRAAAASRIPLISAVGHETDTTLIDYASDRRAPTPTAAAEIAVPVREEWLITLLDHGKRLLIGITRALTGRQEMLIGLARGLPQPARLIDIAAQRLDDWCERLSASLPNLLAQKNQQLLVACAQLQPGSLMRGLGRHAQEVQNLSERLHRLTLRTIADRSQKLANLHQLLQHLDYRKVLERGYVLVRDGKGHIVTRAAEVRPGEHRLVFQDGEIEVRA